MFALNLSSKIETAAAAPEPETKKKKNMIVLHHCFFSFFSNLINLRHPCTHGEEGQLVIGAMRVDAVEMSSCHIHSANNQR